MLWNTQYTLLPAGSCWSGTGSTQSTRPTSRRQDQVFSQVSSSTLRSVWAEPSAIEISRQRSPWNAQYWLCPPRRYWSGTVTNSSHG